MWSLPRCFSPWPCSGFAPGSSSGEPVRYILVDPVGPVPIGLAAIVIVVGLLVILSIASWLIVRDASERAHRKMFGE